MSKTLKTLSILFLGTFILLSFSKKSFKLKGDWKIETVVVSGDTLFKSGTIQTTFEFYNKNLDKIELTEAFKNYQSNCLKGTYYSFQTARLNFKKKSYSHSVVYPCWDLVKINAITEGRYSETKDVVTLNDLMPDTPTPLKINRTKNILTYSNSELDYQIIYTRL